MKLLYSILLIATIGSAFAAPTTQSTELPAILRQLEGEIEALKEQAKGCNANVCFALTGSNRLNAEQFKNQKNFVIAMSAILAGNPLELAAVQYGVFNRAISNLTPDLHQFTLDTLAAEFAGDSFSAPSSGILWCQGQLRKRPNEANKIVLITDGRNVIGRAPAVIADMFRATGGDVCVVGVGPNRNPTRLLNIAGGDSSRVLTVNSYFELKDKLAWMVSEICGTELI